MSERIPDPDQWSEYGATERVDEPEGPPKGSDQKRARLAPLHWSELRDRPRRRFLVKGLLDAGAFAVLFGASNSGKTFLAADLGLAIARDTAWQERAVRQGAAVYIAAEGGLGLEERLEAYARHHGIDRRPIPFFVVATGIDLCRGDGDTDALVTQIENHVGPPALLIVDTLSRAMAGGNENAPDDMGAFVANIDKIRQATGATILAVHHTGKDDSRGARGHSLLRAAADSEIEVTNANGQVTATVTKQRDHPSGDAFGFRLEPIEIGQDDDGDAITSCVLIPTEVIDRKAQKIKLRGQAKIAFDLLKKALNEAGETPPASAHRPDKKLSVTEATWRRYCEVGRLADSDEPDNQRRAFVRVRDALREKQVIGIWEEWVWIA